jgi:hypothetical protein
VTATFADRRGNRDFLASGIGILLLGALMLMIAWWYVRPAPGLKPPLMHGRVTYVLQQSAMPAPIHFSLPSKIGFSRTVQPGDPKATTTLGPRAADIRFLPREPEAEFVFPVPVKSGPPAFNPWREEEPVFKPLGPGDRRWTMVAESLNGPGLVLPQGFEEAAQWPAAGAWTAIMRLEAGDDGRVKHAFLMPPVPEAGVAGRIEILMRKARIEGSRSCRVKISRVDVPAETGQEGAK